MAHRGFQKGGRKAQARSGRWMRRRRGRGRRRRRWRRSEEDPRKPKTHQRRWNNPWQISTIIFRDPRAPTGPVGNRTNEG
eukprot:8271275-Pyramimonas_sp.AAC.1